MRVLVTGALGFLGHGITAALLDAGHQVVGLTHRADPPDQPFPVAVADLRDPAALTAAIGEAGPLDGVCHLAALTAARGSFEQPLAYYDTNVSGTVNLLHALADTQNTPPRVVFASTAAIYGSNHPSPLREDYEPHPESPYAASKLACEDLLAYHAATGAIGSTAIRTFNIAGAVNGVTDTDATRIIPAALAVARGERPAFQVNGDGSVIREYTHVLDVAGAYRLALESTTPGEHHLYNVGSGHGISIIYMLNIIKEVTGKPLPIEHRPPRTEPPELVADVTKAHDELCWSPRHSAPHQIIADAWNVDTSADAETRG